ncbi:MAG: antibiotic biosynthesis monooxygenase [Thermoplasmata archaeon]|nr:antibiotic biosynthesis monooxygenase [Thermoplasmata archaeon]
MSWIAVNRISVDTPADADRIVDAFRHRTGKVDLQPGFEHFEVWREESGREVMVLTRWRDRADFGAWTESAAFREAHHRAKGAPGSPDGSVYEVVL